MFKPRLLSIFGIYKENLREFLVLVRFGLLIILKVYIIQYWNPRRNSIVYFTLFLKFNSSAFFFRDSIM